MYDVNDTIVAIATALSPAGIGVLRVSGEKATEIVSSIFVDKNKKNIILDESHKIKYGYIYDKEKNEFIDEVLCFAMLKPKSYTAEDVVEVQCHGGVLVTKKILSLILKNGARIAEPGEFTKRAFLNGRIDLSKAEAVADIIMSKNDYALKAGFAELKGNLSDKINQYREEIKESIAYIEASLDDPEHMSLEGFKTKLEKQVNEIIKELDEIIKNYDNGKIIKEGINTVIIGKPNVGKSSILNILLGEERAIVTDIAGTTRDVIKESINLNGVTLNIIDTAGIRQEKNIDVVEKIGIEKSKKEAEKADLILIVVDATEKDNEEEKKLISMCEELKKKYIIIVNKIDLKERKYNISNKEVPIIDFSAKTKKGIDRLKETIESMYVNKKIDFNNEIFISNERQLETIKNAKKSLLNVIEAINNDLSEDFLTIDINDAYFYSSKVLGKEISDDIINEIFSKFCMGK